VVDVNTSGSEAAGLS
jgi:hypothetical protein